MRKIHYGIFSLLIAIAMLSLPGGARAQVSIGVSITTPPPAIPVYTQPICPGPNYIWTPGYWAWGPDGYYWVPGTWVVAPAVGVLWTPGYWGWGNGVYLWHAGYWGPHVGFYGGINYGFAISESDMRAAIGAVETFLQ
jgi:WXXGXW repeat (2 copies)